MSYDLDFLKKVLSVPTKTTKEDLMIQFIVDWCIENNLPYVVDEVGNVYVTKQISEVSDDFMFPCVVSHTDTVHILDSINVVEEIQKNAQKVDKLALKAYNDDGKPTGIGGDDKAGIFACLTLLNKLPYLKAAFFVSEETGCLGSRRADKSFFSNVGYAIQFDSPENWMVSEYLMGVPLFERETEFFNTCNKVLTENTSDHQYMKHPYTDVYVLRTMFNFACINVPIGYYRYHTPHEYVVIEDVYNGIDMGEKMISMLGYSKHAVSKTTQRGVLF